MKMEAKNKDEGKESMEKETHETEKDMKKAYNENKLMLPSFPSNDDFLQTMNSLFDLLRWIGVPVRGGYFAMIFSAIIMTLLVVIDAGALWKVFKVIAGKTLYATGNRSVVARISGSIFYGNGVVSLILLWRLRFSWRGLSMEWANIERSSGLYVPPDRSLRRKMLFVISIIGVGATVEHTMSMVSVMRFDIPSSEFFEDYIIASHAFMLIKSDYDIRFSIILFILNKIATILWNLQDLIIILISMGLTSRYERLNSLVSKMEIKLIKGSDEKTEFEQYLEAQLWRKLREAYVRQAALVRKVDQDFGAIILLSNSNNFYFICLQLFHGMGGDNKQSLLDRIYFGISICWLFYRACSVVLAAANINIHSRRGLRFLYTCPNKSYNIEVRRLEHQLKKDFVALSGMGFFYLDRNMLLEVAAAIFKYELVLLEFDR